MAIAKSVTRLLESEDGPTTTVYAVMRARFVTVAKGAIGGLADNIAVLLQGR